MSFRSIYDHYNDPELPVEPPETKVDGALQCCECEETIPGDSYYFDINGMYFCEECMKEHRHIAPYTNEWR